LALLATVLFVAVRTWVAAAGAAFVTVVVLRLLLRTPPAPARSGTQPLPLHAETQAGPTFDPTRTPTPLTIHPRKDQCREPFMLKVSSPGWFRKGGFTVGQDGGITVHSWGGRTASCRGGDVAAVILTRCLGGRRPDWRVLLVGGDGRVVLKDTGFFYTDEDLDRLAAAIGCPFKGEQFSRFSDMQEAHPGVFAWSALAHPHALGLALFVAIFAVILVVVAVAGALGQ
jgi:hypothetical protein